MTKTAFVAIVGKPNVGKSSLLNKMLGQKIAIVSSKPQTTRTKIMGVLTKGETQLVFTDTPGFHKAHNKLGEKMNEAVGDTVGGVDACLFLTEPRGELNEQELQLLEMFKKQKMSGGHRLYQRRTGCICTFQAGGKGGHCRWHKFWGLIPAITPRLWRYSTA